MKKLMATLLTLPALVYAQDFVSFGGVWLGSTTYPESDTPALNVGSFFMGRSNMLGGRLHYGYALSANTDVVSTSVVSGTEALSFTGIATHIPFEANVALVYGTKIRGWVGAGTNVSLVQGRARVNYSIYDTATGATITCSATASGRTDLNFGLQFFFGGEYVFGKLPFLFIGGTWGAFAQFKYMWVNQSKLDVSGEVECQRIDAFGVTTVKRDVKSSMDLKLENSSLVFGFTYHF